MKRLFPLALAALALTGCAQGNLRSPGSLRSPRPSPGPQPVVRPLRALRLVERHLAAARLRPPANDREAGRASFARLAP
jgi:hypothetical protein